MMYDHSLPQSPSFLGHVVLVGYKLSRVALGTRIMYDIIVFEKLRFRPSTRKRETGIFKNLLSKTVFKNLRLGGGKTSFTFGRKKGSGYVWTE